jgi:hypothetical protein
MAEPEPAITKLRDLFTIARAVFFICTEIVLKEMYKRHLAFVGVQQLNSCI